MQIFNLAVYANTFPSVFQQATTNTGIYLLKNIGIAYRVCNIAKPGLKSP